MQILVGWEQHFKLIIFLGVIIQKGKSLQVRVSSSCQYLMHWTLLVRGAKNGKALPKSSQQNRISPRYIRCYRTPHLGSICNKKHVLSAEATPALGLLGLSLSYEMRKSFVKFKFCKTSLKLLN